MTKILIIEDEIRLADVLYDWFHSKNFQVTVCHDGISGYETALKNSYDAIISDVMLPGIDGFSIVKNLRSMKVRTPVTVMKASLDMLEREGIHSKYLDLKEGDEVVECDLIIIEESLLIRTPHVSWSGISFR